MMKSKIVGISAILLLPYVYLLLRIDDEELKRSILMNGAFSFVGFLITLRMIPVASRYLSVNYNDLFLLIYSPESLGIVVGTVFLAVVILFLGVAILFQPLNLIADSTWLVQYNSALTSICFMILLGFVDDVLDIPWRMKLVLPLVAALPLLMAYTGHTTIVIPKPLIPHLGFESLDLGWMYKLYMCLLAVFCTNSINIHAGINGLEVGQTVVIASAILIHNILRIGASTGNSEYQQAHLFSIHLIQPLFATSLALLSYNWYPSAVFVGDTYTYFAGMTMAVAGILGHYSETLLIFFAPQVINFILSIPQIAGIIPCPRHRLPRFDPQTGLLTGTKNGTLVNFCLRRFGRMYEQSLCIVLLSIQAFACGFCFLLWWLLVGWYK
ncbi:UDP-N-acetylglucosamine--dolichyl-phosphate N-acetylglucosaminephosphotransferase-like [Chenopodium quinoa]|uniref:UDP-N-acetylglucosamine--dolichyl-phosphate N-acetylglucosaminephosphotransferase-like n=1 Tax=Chenopodium quinoa TaxID=63459 RepID=UPI000B784B98|nr:UDP-N-acetylglucosamine--dolichyl-phosphate N-acetylglucosaminephosphotransferase-like [Chenopodium quinoa]